VKSKVRCEPDACPFCEVSDDGKVAQVEHGFAVRDRFPVAEGHTLVIPDRHVGSIFDLPAPARDNLWNLVAGVRLALQEELGTLDFTIGVNDGPHAGQTVSHAHIHVIPRRPGDVEDPRGGIRWVIPDRAPYWAR